MVSKVRLLLFSAKYSYKSTSLYSSMGTYSRRFRVNTEVNKVATPKYCSLTHTAIEVRVLPTPLGPVTNMESLSSFI